MLADALSGVLLDMPYERATILVDFGERKRKPAPKGETPAQRRERQRLEREDRSMIPELRRQNARLQQVIELADRQLEEGPMLWNQVMAKIAEAEAKSKIAIDAVGRFNIFIDKAEEMQRTRKRPRSPDGQRARPAPRRTTPRNHGPPTPTESPMQQLLTAIENHEPPDPGTMSPIERGLSEASGTLAKVLGVATVRAQSLWKKWRGGK